MYTFAEFCCVCLKKENKLQSIKSTDIAYVELLHKFNSCMLRMKWSKISKNEILICETCNCNLQITYDFLKLCRKTTNRMENYIKILENGTDPDKNMPGKYSIELVDIKIVKGCPEDSPIVDKNATTIDNMLIYEVDKFEITEDEFADEFTNFEEEITDSEENQTLQGIGEPKEITKSINENDDINCLGFSTEEMHKSYLYSKELNRKIKQDNENFQQIMQESSLFNTNRSKTNGSKCLVCNKTFAHKSSLYKHYKIHSGDKRYQCTQCLKKFVQKAQLTDHMSSHSKARPYECSICKKRYTRYNTLYRHLSVHSSVKAECLLCNRKFSCKLYLDRHHTTVHTDRDTRKLYRCATCGKDFCSSSSLHAHHLIHTGEKSHQCSLCSKRFTHKSTLTRHMLVHTGMKQHTCPYCKKQFGLKNNLMVHMMIHNGVKPYKCSTCDSSFVQKASLIQHEKIHNDDRPHKCTVCLKPFRSKSAMHQHQQVHSKARNIECTFCGARFKLKSYLRRHIARHHSE